jgi:hypothetical protein
MLLQAFILKKAIIAHYLTLISGKISSYYYLPDYFNRIKIKSD